MQRLIFFGNVVVAVSLYFWRLPICFIGRRPFSTSGVWNYLFVIVLLIHFTDQSSVLLALLTMDKLHLCTPLDLQR